MDDFLTSQVNLIISWPHSDGNAIVGDNAGGIAMSGANIVLLMLAALHISRSHLNSPDCLCFRPNSVSPHTML